MKLNLPFWQRKLNLHWSVDLKHTGLVVSMVATVAAVGSIVSLSRAQSSNPTAPDQSAAISVDSAARQSAIRAILDPVGFAAEVENRKTDQDRLADESSARAILDPVAVNAELEKQKTEVQRQREFLSRMAITQPAAYAAAVEKLITPEQRQRDAAALFEILHPDVLSLSTPLPEIPPELGNP